MNQELNQQIPQFNLHSKILCRVVHIRLLVCSISILCMCVGLYMVREFYLCIFIFSLFGTIIGGGRDR